METTNVTVKEFIKEYLIKQIGEIKDKYPYFAFMLMGVGIEFLGRCLDGEHALVDEDQNGNSKRMFRKGFELLDMDEFDSQNVYKKIRCGLVHGMLVGKNLTLSDCGSNGSQTISCEDFYDKFKKACEKVIGNRVENKLPELLEMQFLVVSETMGDNGQIVTTSGRTDSRATRMGRR